MKIEILIKRLCYIPQTFFGRLLANMIRTTTVVKHLKKTLEIFLLKPFLTDR